jgi:hypothetical protein
MCATFEKMKRVKDGSGAQTRQTQEDGKNLSAFTRKKIGTAYLVPY